MALAALISLVVALLSPLDSLSEALFAAHMLQHMLLLLVAPAFLLADPLPLVLWGLPHRIRLRVDHLFAAGEVLQLVYLVLAAFQKAVLVRLCTFCALEERHQEHSTSIKAEKPAE